MQADRKSPAAGHAGAARTQFRHWRVFRFSLSLCVGQSGEPLSPLVSPAGAPSYGGQARGEGNKLRGMFTQGGAGRGRSEGDADGKNGRNGTDGTDRPDERERAGFMIATMRSRGRFFPGPRRGP